MATFDQSRQCPCGLESRCTCWCAPRPWLQRYGNAYPCCVLDQVDRGPPRHIRGRKRGERIVMRGPSMRVYISYGHEQYPSASLHRAGSTCSSAQDAVQSYRSTPCSLLAPAHAALMRSRHSLHGHCAWALWACAWTALSIITPLIAKANCMYVGTVW